LNHMGQHAKDLKRIDLMQRRPSIDELFSLISELNESAELQTLFDIFEPNSYGKPTPGLGRLYKVKFKEAGFEFRLYVYGFDSYLLQNTHIYETHQMGMGYLDRWSTYSYHPGFNDGFTHGFYLDGRERRTLIMLGANPRKSPDSYIYLKEKFDKHFKK
jgi:hypothetical protein